jgi:hypothetical protein
VARALWALQALKREYDVTLVTSGPVDVRCVNACYGTGLNREDFTVLRVSSPPA